MSCKGRCWVGMQELDQNLAKVICTARERPVSVFRYGQPWVYIVSQEAWQQALKDIDSCIPPNHCLVQSRAQIEAILDSEAAMLDALAAQQQMQLDPNKLMRALLLHLLYSISDVTQLHEYMRYNLLFRWFAGLQLSEQVCSLELFRREVGIVLDSQDAALLMQRVIDEVFSDDLLQMPEFSMNFALLEAWQTKFTSPLNQARNDIAVRAERLSGTLRLNNRTREVQRRI